MRAIAPRAVTIALALLIASPALAGTLDSKTNEWDFSLSYIDEDFSGKTTTFSLDWGWIFGKGYHELGALVTYVNFDPDFGNSQSATVIGPAYTWNWTPDSDRATGFAQASFGAVGGDLGDAYDSAWQVSVGIKAFVGDSAAVTARIFHQTLVGSNFFADVDTKGLAVGISIFTGRR